jgi:hypothetical protein
MKFMQKTKGKWAEFANNWLLGVFCRILVKFMQKTDDEMG